ncbi:hypothetical protein BHM03_00019890 [Ensete ventricosum]|uniref:Uncharacterized protein n=1 Tax=Ensete ventricosum TaxID=4639 RepID=A0A445MFQ5_ENSVE|nr:hypothetical protein BHM03_00019890 [Ensete ventricosum]
MVRTTMADGRKQQVPRRLGRLLRQRPTIVVGRHGRKAALEDKGRWWPGREGSGAARDNDRGLAGGEEEEEERKSNVGRDGRQWWQGGETAVAGVTGNDDVAG